MSTERANSTVKEEKRVKFPVLPFRTRKKPSVYLFVTFAIIFFSFFFLIHNNNEFCSVFGVEFNVAIVRRSLVYSVGCVIVYPFG